MMTLLIYAVNLFFQLLLYLVLGRAILSWFVRSPYGALYRLYALVTQVTEPILAPCRLLLSRFGLGGSIDFSPVLAIIGLTVLNGIVINLLRMFMF
jgi:YggT family protein